VCGESRSMDNGRTSNEQQARKGLGRLVEISGEGEGAGGADLFVLYVDGSPFPAVFASYLGIARPGGREGPPCRDKKKHGGARAKPMGNSNAAKPG
jgi:hypothetical protein